MRAALPLVIPTALIGASFGVAAVTTGWGSVAPVVMSAIVFSGAAQFATLAVLSAGATVLRNERNVGYTASLNRGLALARGTFSVLLNDDVLPRDG